MEQTHGPMDKNRIQRPTAPDEEANGSEVRIHQRCWWYIRWSRGEGGRTYLGRSARCHGIVTEGFVRISDRRAEVSSGRSSSDLGTKAQTVPPDKGGKGKGK